MIAWREGSNRVLSSRFAAMRVRPAHRDMKRANAHDELWLLIEWPLEESEPAKYWFACLPERTSRKHLVTLAKQRWRIERDFQDLKQELGLGHFEGRGWRGFHHHGTLCIAAYGFLVAQRLSLETRTKKNTPVSLKAPRLPKSFRPRGAADSRSTP
jgi:SRSO17 transposase